MGRIRKATTAGSRGFICMYSESGGGKTYSALLLARGMVGPKGRIVLIDTENRRGELYADDPLIGGYDVLPLGEPYSPMAYSAAIQEAEDEGADAIIVDSGSHEWEGPGGVLDMAVARANGGQPQFGHWKEPKAAHKKMIQRMMRSSAHIIVCLRAQYKSRQIEKKDWARYGIDPNTRGSSAVIRDDFQSPIQDASFIFETTVHLYFSNKNPGVPIVTKCPDMLLDAFPEDKLITTATGAKVAAFYNSGAPTNQATAELIKEARRQASKGRADYEAWFTKQITAEQRRELVTLGEHEALKVRLAEPETYEEGTARQILEEGNLAPRGRLQDPPAEPTDDGRPDHGDDDFPGDKPAGYVEPDFNEF